MAISQKRSRRKPTGGMYKPFRKKRLNELGGLSTLTKLAARKASTIRIRGGKLKTKLLSINIANVLDPKTNKAKMANIKTVVGNPANRHFIRRNIITKGTIIETDLGKAKVTSRPGQEGTINAVLV